MTVEELKRAFVYAYQQKADAVYFVPGHICLIGEHVLCNNDSDITSALSVGIYLLLRKNNEKCIKFWSLNEPEAINWNINQPIPKNINSWLKYPIGIFKKFINDKYDLDCGYDTLFWGNMPKGTELLPSEGLEIITAFALKDQICKYQSSTQNPQIRNHSLSYINLNIIPVELVSEITETLYARAEGYKVVISNTYIPHKVDVSPYLQRITESKLAFEYLNKIRPVYDWDGLTEDEFKTMVSTIENPVAIKAAYHAISEVYRTKQAIKAIKENDLKRFGQLMYDSHISLRDNLEIVSPEVDAIVSEALKIDGVLGSRMAGCGFGGCTISLVKEEAIDLFVKRVGHIYEDITGVKNYFYIANIGDCACKLF